LELDIRAAKNSGVRPDELKEALQQVAAYGRISAAYSAFVISENL